ncbi:unnamed protein product [Cyclocybe aegerita]|uniref:DUF6534 domain-containing protein n=1 Tax=Cyclocybe aegerita TaxID=1973307 RepID=A0A8S0WSH5_CYCAE|nr:unnamed protein product [Cyclocybe aegerita]
MDFDRSGTLGAAFLGGIAASILYGVTSVQTLIYFQGTHKDGRAFKSLIFFLWILDTLHFTFTVHGLYFYFVSHFGDFVVLREPPWSLVAGVYLTTISDMIVRCIFAHRVSILCGRSRRVLRVLLPIVISALAFVVFVNGMGFATGTYILGTFERMNKIAPMLYLSLSSAVAADSTVAISLCVLLFASRTGIKRTDSLLTLLIAFSINTGLLTSLCALATLITYAIWPHRFIFMGLYFTLSKLYVNSLLASLNARLSLWSHAQAQDRRRASAETERFEDVGTRVTFVVGPGVTGKGTGTSETGMGVEMKPELEVQVAKLERERDDELERGVKEERRRGDSERRGTGDEREDGG